MNQVEQLMIEKSNIIPEIGLSQENTISSLNYARVIQNSILCSREGLFDLFDGRVSIVYKPKNILSGDFYFYHEKGDDLYFAVCDCTGHGISGALLSILGHNMLERSLKKFDGLNDIMPYFNKTVTDSFSDQSTVVEAGMDMVIVRLNRKSKKMQFSGARRPLWILRNGELLTYKTNRCSIGATCTDNQSWKVEEIQMQEGDRVIMFSDGITDQFGICNYKKFGKKLLSEICLELENKPQKEFQKSVTTAFEAYKGNNIQTDDVLFISFDI